MLRADLARRLAELGVVACIQPGFAVSDAEEAQAALGGDRVEEAYRWDALLDAGVRVVAGSDFPIEPLDPLGGLQQLTTGGGVGAPTLPVARALALMADASAGTVVLSDDPLRVAEDELASIEVVEARPAG